MTLITGSNPGTAFTDQDDQTLIVAPNATVGGLANYYSGAVLINYGTVNSSGQAVYFSNSASGQFINKPGAVVTNAFAGVTIEKSGDVINQGVILTDCPNTILGGGEGIVLLSGATNGSIVNSGDIFGNRCGISIQSSIVLDISISNSGEIRGDEHGIELSNATGAAPVIVNTGTIIGRINSILAQSGDRLNVTNSGTLSGNVLATSANQADKLINNGTVNGNVSLGSGIDLYQGSGSVSGIVFGEAGNDSLTGGALADRFNGGADADTLTGNSGNDVLNGTSGNDKLIGGLGIDSLSGGTDVDFFIFNTAPNTAANRDFINDFSHVDDTLQFENAVFAKLGGAGMLSAQFLRLGAAPLDANDYLIYNKATGVLTYDINGNGAGGAQQVAQLTTKPVLALGDFVVI